MEFNHRMTLAAVGWRAGLLALLLCVAPALRAADDPPPDATPQIQNLQPAQGAPGAELKLTIQGENFSRGVYVSFSNPAMHTVSTHRSDAKKIEVRVQIGAKATPGPVTLYVSNPASAAAETTFTVTGETSATAGVAPAVTAAASPAPAPAAPESASPPGDAPVVNSIEPSHVGRGSTVAIKVKGKGFVQGARVAFSNPGIIVTRTDFNKTTELTAYLQVAADAPTGQTSLFVVNPDNSEVEAQFEITSDAPTTTAGAESPPSSTTTTQSSTTSQKKSAGDANKSATQSFEVYNLGQAVSIFQGGKAQGTLSVAGRTLKYEEEGKEVFSAAAKDVKEIALTSIAGFSIGAFHVILNTGKMYNFMPASLRANDSQTIVNSLLKALQ